MKKIILTLLISIISIPINYGQDTGITGVSTGDLFSGGNVDIKKINEKRLY